MIDESNISLPGLSVLGTSSMWLCTSCTITLRKATNDSSEETSVSVAKDEMISI